MTSPDNDLVPRLVVLTDISSLTAGVREPDDGQSLIRLMLYANEFDIAGLIASSNLGHGQVVRPELIRQVVDAYGQVHANLLLHDRAYPDPAYLRSCIKAGQPIAGPRVPVEESIGEGKDTAASEWLIEVADRPDPRPLWIAVWGGTADLAQALWRVSQSRPQAAVDEFVRRLRVYAVGNQDSTGPWIKENYPDLFYITTNNGIRGMYRGGDESLVREAWVRKHIAGHGALGDLYPCYDGGDIWSGRLGKVLGIKEGDTPSFLTLVANGLANVNEPDWRPEWGSWGGRFVPKAEGVPNRYVNGGDRIAGCEADPDPRMAAIYRWRPAYQADFQARLDWCIADFAGANHPPVPAVNSSTSRRTVRLSAAPGDKVILSAAGSTDPDGDRLSFTWWIYEDAGTCSGVLTEAQAPETTLIIPPDCPAGEVHVILQVTDDGEPPLTRYRRVVVSVGGRSNEA